MVSGVEILTKTKRGQLLMLCLRKGMLNFFIDEFAEKTRRLSMKEAEKIAEELLEKVKNGEV